MVVFAAIKPNDRQGTHRCSPQVPCLLRSNYEVGEGELERGMVVCAAIKPNDRQDRMFFAAPRLCVRFQKPATANDLSSASHAFSLRLRVFACAIRTYGAKFSSHPAGHASSPRFPARCVSNYRVGLPERSDLTPYLSAASSLPGSLRVALATRA